MSPASPTFVALSDRLINAHRRIRELESGEAELIAQISMLRDVVAELTHEVRPPSTPRAHFNDGAGVVA